MVSLRSRAPTHGISFSIRISLAARCPVASSRT